MRKTLRRSCDACAKSKLSCDLRIPHCSRCGKRKTVCAYANQPLTATVGSDPATNSGYSYGGETNVSQSPATIPQLVLRPVSSKLDPFESYPPTRLDEAHVQTLIQHFLSCIAFQYYPLDRSPISNPFVISWWPSALADPALFHVSLQTASLDLDLREGKGFAKSELLMADSVSLVRQRIEDPSLACQDESLDSVVTLAAIEFGKGNTALSSMHIEGVKRMVEMRGGIRRVKSTSPLTARMVTWVSLILMQSPQFSTDNHGDAEGLPAISQWYKSSFDTACPYSPFLPGLEVEEDILFIMTRLKDILHQDDMGSLSSNEFHDLTCFVMHRLLELSGPTTARRSSVSESIRLALALFMLTIHGPTYFSHAHLQQNLVSQLKDQAQNSLDVLIRRNESLALWILFVGMANAYGSSGYLWFYQKAHLLIKDTTLITSESMRSKLREVLWCSKADMSPSFQLIGQILSSSFT